MGWNSTSTNSMTCFFLSTASPVHLYPRTPSETHYNLAARPSRDSAKAGSQASNPFVYVPGTIALTDDILCPLTNIHGHNSVQIGSNRFLSHAGKSPPLDSVMDTDFVWAWASNASGLNNSLGNEGTGDFNWAILLLAPLVVFGIAGNTLVILAISLERRLQNVTNYFLLSLAVTDLLVSLIVMPFSIIKEFTGQWLFGIILCNLFITADVMMCTSSILHLCTISLERYIGIRYPLWTKNKSKRTVLLKIVLVWTLAIAITSPITVLGIVTQSNILQDDQCLLSNQHFIIYGSVLAFFIPLTIMVVMYALTVRMLNRQAKLCTAGDKENEGEPIIRRSTSRRQWRRPGLQSEENNFDQREPLTSTKSYPMGSGTQRYTKRYQPLVKRNTLPRYSRGPLAPTCSTDVESALEYDYNQINTNNSDTTSDNSEQRDRCWRIFTRRTSNFPAPAENSEEPKRLRELVRKHHVAVRAANILLMKKDILRKENNAVHTEQKASKVLGVVFMIFVVCWTPFFLANILTVLCPDCYLSSMLFTAFVWLGYVSSTLNPIIYTVFNKVFKVTFIKLLRCRYGLLHRGRRRSSAALLMHTTAMRTVNTSSGLITCNSYCARTGEPSMEESMC